MKNLFALSLLSLAMSTQAFSESETVYAHGSRAFHELITCELKDSDGKTYEVGTVLEGEEAENAAGLIYEKVTVASCKDLQLTGIDNGSGGSLEKELKERCSGDLYTSAKSSAQAKLEESKKAKEKAHKPPIQWGSVNERTFCSTVVSYETPEGETSWERFELNNSGIFPNERVNIVGAVEGIFIEVLVDLLQPGVLSESKQKEDRGPITPRVEENEDRSLRGFLVE